MKIFRYIFFLSILFFIFLFFYTSDFIKVFESLHRIGFRFFILILVTFSAAFLSTLGWRYCLGEDGKKISITNLFVARHIGEMFAVINPTSVVAGDALKVYLLKNADISKKKIIASVLISRFLKILSQLFLFAIILAFIIYHNLIVHIQYKKIIYSLGSIILSVLLIVIVSKRFGFLYKRFANTKIGNHIDGRIKFLQSKIVILREEVRLQFRQNKKGLSIAFVLFFIHWLMGPLECYFIFKFLEINVSLMQAIIMDHGVVIIKSLGSFIPGQIGVEELGNRVVLALIGVSTANVWLTFSVLRRTRQIFWILVALIMYLFRVYLKKEDMSSIVSE